MLPIFTTGDKDLALLQTRWAQQLNPLLRAPMSKGFILQGVELINGTTVVNHLLSRKLQGWYVVDQDASAIIYRSAPKNDLTLTLTSNAAVTVDLFVF